MKKVNKKLVIVTFLDHAMTDGTDITPAKCEAVGYLIKEDKDAIYLATWICEEEINTSDTELFAIIKHPSLRIKRVRLD